jgi:ribosome maturation factor RimP
VPAARGGALRIYIDSPEGVTVDQCAEVSRHLNLILDVEDPLPGPYTLEVSSPGLERPFFSCEQLNPYLGQRIVLQLKEAIQDSKKWRGTLISADNNTIVLQTHVQEIAVSWSNVKKAHLLYEQ